MPTESGYFVGPFCTKGGSYKGVTDCVGSDYEAVDKGAVITELYNLVDDPREQHPIGHRWEDGCLGQLRTEYTW